MSASSDLYSRPDIPRAERPVKLGSFLFTIVEPHKGQELAYSRWYERDHLLGGCMVAAHMFAANRYVATRDCKALRYGEMDPAKGSYFAMYWIEGDHYEDWSKWAVNEVQTNLGPNGRMHTNRDHIHTAFYRYVDEYNAPGSNMPSELALDRAYGGVVGVILKLAPGVEVAQVQDFFRNRVCPGDVMVMGEPQPLPEGASNVGKQEEKHLVQAYFSIEDPRTVWAERYAKLGEEFAAAGLGRVSFASPFIPVVMGTDTYVDQL